MTDDDETGEPIPGWPTPPVPGEPPPAAPATGSDPASDPTMPGYGPPPGAYPPGGYPPPAAPPPGPSTFQPNLPPVPGYGQPGAAYPPGGYAPPAGGGYAPSGYGFGGYSAPREHPQGTTILVLGIGSIICCGLLGPVAWVMGNNALKEIDRNPAAYSNRGNVQAGRIIGIVATVLLALSAALWIFLLIIGAASSTTA